MVGETQARCGKRDAGSVKPRVRIPHLASRIPRRASALLLVALGSCATLGKLSFKEPDIRLERIDITGLSLGGGTLDLVFDVYNPNTFRIRSTRMEVDLDLEETHFGTALLERPLDLSPDNHSRVIVPTRFEWAGLGAGARALLTKRAVGYGLVGKVILDTPLGDETVALKANGSVPLRKLVR